MLHTAQVHFWRGDAKKLTRAQYGAPAFLIDNLVDDDKKPWILYL